MDNTVITLTPLELSSNETKISDEELKELLWDKYRGEIRKSLEGKKQKGNLKLQLLDTIAQVQRRYLQRDDPKVVFGDLLTALLDLMDSEYGFIGEIKQEEDGTKYLQTHAITNIAWNAATLKFYEENVDAGLKFYNMNSLFGSVIVTQEPVISNDPKTDRRGCGIPEGHPPLNHFLGIPFFERGGQVMNGMVGIANKPGGYSTEDIEFLEPFVVTCSSLIQGYQFMRENKYLINTLEEKVQERTRELRAVNQELAVANEEILRASAAQLEHFACMSHEIRTPLNCIIGLSSLLQESDLTPMQEDSIRMMVTSGNLLLAVVNDILDYSKLATGNVEIDAKPSKLQAALDAVVQSIEMKAKDRNLTLVTKFGPTVPDIVNTDARRLQQILYNLLGNAVKFAHEDSQIELKVHVKDVVTKDVAFVEMPSAEGTKELPCYMPANHEEMKTSADASRCPFLRGEKRPVSATKSEIIHIQKRVLQFQVKDYGRGIDSRDFTRIFQPFRQAKGDVDFIYEGTGLGLAITSKLVHGLNGSISVDSEVGDWTEFTVDFPIEQKFAGVGEIREELSNARILFINTDPLQDLPIDVIDEYQLNIAKLDSSASLDVLTSTVGAIDPGRLYICLIHEDLYDPNVYYRFTQKARSVLLTFGPQYKVKQSIGHFRNLSQILPSVLLASLITYKNTTIRVQTTALADSSPNNTKSVCYENLRTLVVDDNIINQKVLHRILTRIGVQAIDVAANGQEAVNLCSVNTYDFVFLDMQMPVMDGLEACNIIVSRRHKSRDAIPKIIFVTANVSPSFEEMAQKAGGDGFISKPFNLEKIVQFFKTL